MTNPFLGEIIIFGGNFNIRNYAFCNGQLLQVAQNTALFSLLGTTYGGDGRTTFGLPNLQGRIPMGWGTGPGLTSRRLGEKTGTETVELSSANLPNHTHALRAAQEDATTTVPTGASLAIADESIYRNAGTQVTMAAQSLGNAGSSPAAEHNNDQPYLSLNFIIALQGTYPSRS